MRARCSITVEGTVQGVGFRPFVFRLAAQHGLGGSVRNDSSGVVIEVEGESAKVDEFCDRLRGAGPPLARVDQIHLDYLQVLGEHEFHIGESCTGQQQKVAIPADTATCQDCLAELFDPQDRRCGYPLINCTNCGPRLTIMEDVPYDRARTTMAAFAMCDACQAEYEDPTNRRFHAEPIACPECGPRLTLCDSSGTALGTCDPIARAAEALAAGQIVAVKGLGGYHLACNALSEPAVTRLRRRKRRDAKPLAIMVRDVAAARRLCRVDSAEEELLGSPHAPIVLLERRPDSSIANEVAPGQACLGVMLAYAPVHHLLLAALQLPLVMTSGNVSDEPIAHRDADALMRLAGIADLFLTPIRRSRGYAPRPIAVPDQGNRPVLALGGDLKNTFAFVRDGEAFISHHIGDLLDVSTYANFGESIRHYGRLLAIEPAAIAHDLHPGYLSTRFAEEWSGVERIAVQHHHAHLAACLADNGTLEPAIGVIFESGLEGFGRSAE